MLKTIITVFVTCSSVLFVFGQKENVIFTSDENEKWYEIFSALPLNGQLEMLNERLLSDSKFYARIGYPAGTKMKDSLQGRFLDNNGKPLVIVENMVLQIDKKTGAGKTIKLTELLSASYISNLSFLKSSDPTASAIYGKRALDGVIFLKLKRKKDIKRFKKWELENK